MMRWSILPVLAYPFIVHAGVIWNKPEAGAIALTLLLGSLLAQPLVQGRYWAWAIFAGAGIIISAFVLSGRSLEMLYFPPVAITLFFFGLFAISLTRGRVPIVTDVALRMGEDRSEEVLRYTRKVTFAWSVLFFLLTVQNILLPLLASPKIWSLFTNYFNYGFIGLFFLVEFWIRGKCLPNHRSKKPVAFFRDLMRTKLR